MCVGLDIVSSQVAQKGPHARRSADAVSFLTTLAGLGDAVVGGAFFPAETFSGLPDGTAERFTATP